MTTTAADRPNPNSLYYEAQREIRPLMALERRIDEGAEYMEDFAIACKEVNRRLAEVSEKTAGMEAADTALNAAAAVVACAGSTAALSVETLDGQDTLSMPPGTIIERRELIASIRWLMSDLWAEWGITAAEDVEWVLSSKKEEVAHA